jgi:hypothetical protein
MLSSGQKKAITIHPYFILIQYIKLNLSLLTAKELSLFDQNEKANSYQDGHTKTLKSIIFARFILI